MMFDALANFIVYLENSLQSAHEPAETLELLRLLKAARRVQAARQK